MCRCGATHFHMDNVRRYARFAFRINGWTPFKWVAFSRLNVLIYIFPISPLHSSFIYISHYLALRSLHSSPVDLCDCMIHLEALNYGTDCVWKHAIFRQAKYVFDQNVADTFCLRPEWMNLTAKQIRAVTVYREKKRKEELTKTVQLTREKFRIEDRAPA